MARTSKAPRTPSGSSAAAATGGTPTPRPAVDGSLEPIAPPPATIVKTHRNRRLIALAVALICLCSVLGWWLFKAATHTTSAVAARSTIHAGQVISASDLGTVNVNANSGLATIPADQLSSLVGQRAQTDLPAGGLVPPGSVAQTSVPGKGAAEVGVSIKPGMAPASNVGVGSPVRVVFLPAQGASLNGLPEPVIGTVVSVSRNVDGTSTSLDVLVPAGDAPTVQSYAALGRLAVVLDTKDR